MRRISALVMVLGVLLTLSPARAMTSHEAITPTYNNVFTITDPRGTDWVYVSDKAHSDRPYTLFVWLHGCGGYSQYDPWTEGDHEKHAHYLTIAPDGAEGGCWLDPNNMRDTGPGRVLTAMRAAIADFNVDPHHIVLGGYSSGGDLAYRTAFEHSHKFVGVLAVNTAPFRDTGLSQQQLLGDATHTFHVVHLAHRQDQTYPLGEVKTEIQAVRAAGFPVTFIKRPGHHYDDSTSTSGTDHDIVTYLLPHLGDDWAR
jgi:poly(3-hydroxybutyrate) depolymerase